MLKNVKNKSSFIAEAVREWIEREDKANLIGELSEGYKVRKKEDEEISTLASQTPVLLFMVLLIQSYNHHLASL